MSASDGVHMSLEEYWAMDGGGEKPDARKRRASSSRKPRSRKKNNQEQRIQGQIINYLEMSPQISWARRHNSGKVKTAWDTWVVLGEKGDSDIFAMFSANAGSFAGKFLGIEVKKPGEKPKPEQVGFIDMVVNDGGVAFSATSVDDVIREFAERGVLS